MDQEDRIKNSPGLLDPKLYANGIIATAHFTAKPGKADEFVAWLRKIKARADSDEEPDTVAFKIARKGDEFTTWEQFASVQAMHLHIYDNPILQELFGIFETLADKTAPTLWPAGELSA